jgi:hypothetical protein
MMISIRALPAVTVLVGVVAGCQVDASARADTAEMNDALTCESTSDCAYATVPLLESEADCACPSCAAEAQPINRDALDRRMAAFRRICRQWAETHPCPPVSCRSPGRLACSDQNECAFAP